ncbi:MAG: glycosyltransferase [Chloroflexia bacterium]
MVGKNKKPKVLIIIPSWTGDVSRVKRSIEQQTFQDYELQVVTGVSPAARARNVGAQRSNANILLFIDDDAYFGTPHVLGTLVDLIESDPTTAVVGTSKLVPKDATPLQKAIARQVPRMVYPVVHAHEESNPPLNRYGFTAVTTTCCAVRRDVFLQVNGFDEELTTGPEDTDFFYRVHKKGYKIIVAKDSWVYHDPPASIKDLAKKSFWYGVGHALEARKSPERRMDVLPLDRWYGKLALPLAALALPFAFFFHIYFDPKRRLAFGFRPLKTLSTYAVLCGYVYGWYRGKPAKRPGTYMGRKPGTMGESISQPRPARVLYLDAYPKFGGGQQVLLSVVTKLNRSRYEPLVALPVENPLRERLIENGVRAFGLPFEPSNYTLPSPLRPMSVPRTVVSLFRVISQTIRLARREKVDLIHANSAVAGVHAIPVARILRIPCIVHSHDFNTSGVTNRLLTVMMRYRGAAMIFVSKVLAAHYRADKLRRYPYKVIHNAVDTNLFRPDENARERFLAELGLPHDTFLIGAIGRIERWKGFDLLMEAFATVAAAHPNARLVMVGDVIFEHLKGVKLELVQQVQRLGIQDKVIFTGFRDDIPYVMSAVDALVHCPVEREGFPMIMIEAMACGRPIVTVPSGGIVEQVFDGVNGFVVPMRDTMALAAATSRLISDPSLARRMGLAGRRMVEERLTIEIQTSQVEQMYDRMLHKAGAKVFGD